MLLFLIGQVKKVKFREVKWLVQGHLASQWQTTYLYAPCLHQFHEARDDMYLLLPRLVSIHSTWCLMKDSWSVAFKGQM